SPRGGVCRPARARRRGSRRGTLIRRSARIEIVSGGRDRGCVARGDSGRACLDYQLDGVDEAIEFPFLGGELLAAGLSEPVKASLAIGLGDAPFRIEPTFSQH